MKILTIDNWQALAGYFAGLGDIRIKGTETWIDPELRGTPTVYCDCGNSAAGRPMFVFFRVGDMAPENPAEAAAAGLQSVATDNSCKGSDPLHENLPVRLLR